MPKKKSDIKRGSSDVSKNSSRAENCVKKKPVKCLKEDEVKREVARIEEESIKNDDFIKVHVSFFLFSPQVFMQLNKIFTLIYI